MSETTTNTLPFPTAAGRDVLSDILREGAQRLLSHAIEAEVAAWINAGASITQFAPISVQVIRAFRDSLACLEAAAFVQWHPLGESDPPDNAVRALFSHQQDGASVLYIGGDFESAGSVPLNHVAKWSGGQWQGLGGGVNDRVRVISYVDAGVPSGIYIGGDFTAAGGAPAGHLARWDGDAWQTLGDGFDGSVYAIAVFDNGTGPTLYVGGEFTMAGTQPASGLARWNGSEWSGVAGGVDGAVYSLQAIKINGANHLIVGGSFQQAGNVVTESLAAWDGEQWSTIGPNFPGGTVRGLATVDHGGGPVLYAGGQIPWPGDSLAPNVVGWNGESWFAATSDGHGVVGDVREVEVISIDGQQRLVVAGQFASAGGDMAINIVQWDGASWLPIGSGPIGHIEVVHTPTESGPVMYIGGLFEAAGGVPAQHIAKWASGGPVIAKHPDGQQVHAGDEVQLTVAVLGAEVILQWLKDGVPLRDDERIIGSTTETLMIDPVLPDDEGMYTVTATGQCGSAMSQPAELSVDVKLGDLNGDGVVDVFDLLILLAKWGECADPDDCPADLDGNGVVDVFDLLILLANWS